MRKTGLVCTLFVLGLGLGSPLAQPAEYKKVYGGDISLGYVPDGQSVETEGYLWVSSTGVFFNVDPISARPPLFVDVAGVPADMLAKVRTMCASETPSLSSGCRVLIRGTVGKQRFGEHDRPGIVAINILLQS